MRSDPKFGTRAKTFRLWTMTVLSGVLAALLVLGGCVLFRPWAPSGHPPCPKGHAWNDSTLACKAVPRER